MDLNEENSHNEEAIFSQEDLGISIEDDKFRVVLDKKSGYSCFTATFLILLSFVVSVAFVYGVIFLLAPKQEIVYQIDVPMKYPTEEVLPTSTQIQIYIPNTELPIPTDTAVPSPIPCVWVVKVDSTRNVNVRNAPKSTALVVKTVKSGILLPFLRMSSDNNWVMIGEQEWVSSTLLSNPYCS